MGTLTRPSQPSPAVTKLLDRDVSSYTWVAATVGAERAAGFQLASGHPVLPLGGSTAATRPLRSDGVILYDVSRLPAA
ncbi:MAG: hypothetical protein ACJ71Y_05345 [Blastococcus sp.]